MAEDQEENQGKDLQNTENNDAGQEGEETPKKGKKKKFIIIGVLFLLLAGGAVAGLMFSGVLDDPAAEEQVAEADAEEEPVEEEANNIPGKKLEVKPIDPSKLTYYELPSFTTNLNSAGNRQNFLKMTVTLELIDKKDVESIEALMPRIENSFQEYLRELRVADLQGSAGLYRLRQELLLRINKNVYPVHVNDILFKEVIVQ